jgi:hypothetical protein
MKGASSSCFAITYPLWQPEFGSALLTLDRKELLERVRLAEALMFSRMQAICLRPHGRGERQAIGHPCRGFTSSKWDRLRVAEGLIDDLLSLRQSRAPAREGIVAG